MEQVNNAVIRVQERLSDCAPKALHMKQREWEKERRVGVDCGRRDFMVRSAEFEGSTTISGDVDVRETIEIVFLHLLSH